MIQHSSVVAGLMVAIAAGLMCPTSAQAGLRANDQFEIAQLQRRIVDLTTDIARIDAAIRQAVQSIRALNTELALLQQKHDDASALAAQVKAPMELAAGQLSQAQAVGKQHAQRAEQAKNAANQFRDAYYQKVEQSSTMQSAKASQHEAQRVLDGIHDHVESLLFMRREHVEQTKRLDDLKHQINRIRLNGAADTPELQNLTDECRKLDHLIQRRIQTALHDHRPYQTCLNLVELTGVTVQQARLQLRNQIADNAEWLALTTHADHTRQQWQTHYQMHIQPLEKQYESLKTAYQRKILETRQIQQTMVGVQQKQAALRAQVDDMARRRDVYANEILRIQHRIARIHSGTRQTSPPGSSSKPSTPQSPKRKSASSESASQEKSAP